MPNLNLEKLFTEAQQQNASDVHLIVGQEPILRINDDLLPITDMPEITETIMQTVFKQILTPAQINLFEEKKDLDISYEIPDGTRFRVNLHRANEKTGLVARIIPLEIPSMETLMMPEVAYDICNLDQGLFIITGPT